MSTLFSLVFLAAAFGIWYFWKKKPNRKRLIGSIVTLVLSSFIVSATSGNSNSNQAASSNSTSSSISIKNESKLKKATMNVDSLFTDSKHTKLLEGTTKDSIDSVKEEVNSLKNSAKKTKLQKDVKKAIALWPAFKKQVEKKESIASSKLAIENSKKAKESSKKIQAKKDSESRAASASAVRISEENARKASESNSISESNAQSLSVSESNRQANILAASISSEKAAASSQSQAASQSITQAAPQGQTVYITRTGTKYHYNQNCQGLNRANSITPISLDDAINQHYTLCKFES